ncbi:lactoylglutathione lyase [Erwinia psidii]|uniref:Lactoylglutathione lyase n=1 Tax=Erwinia psidii TaxID=69224 RepID=A0A3N6SHV7_9GAMM|nr:lactoylglutathione lyase [Erwinia psidii]MCX8960717.1 lactoylglutathione lyase [Erwinia psidii]MCX8964038.1 lactoylglutathione lyase [Erwinia psidii]RQM39523.1 lactoylglutathione lyase [Erwinia psidii]
MRIMHTMLRSTDLVASLDFYCNALKMKVLRREEFPEGKFSLVYVGYGDEITGTVLELTYNWGVSNYEIGNGYGHLAIGARDIQGLCDNVAQLGYKVVRSPGPMKLAPSLKIAFIADPDGFVIELIEE